MDELDQVPLFRDVPAEDLTTLQAAIKEAVHKRGEDILTPVCRREHVHILRLGRVRAYRVAASGRPVTVADLGPGDMYGLGSLEGIPLFEGYVQVTSECARIWHVEARAIEWMRQMHMCVNAALVEFVTRQLTLAQEHIEDLAAYDVEQRVAREVLRKAAVSPRHIVADTHDELAAIVGTTRERVTKALTQIRRRGLVERAPTGHAIVVEDVDRLRRAYEGGK